MTQSERRQRILNILWKQSGITVSELAKLLSVSEGTIRNDLRFLDETKQLSRVHGGAVPGQSQQMLNPVFWDRVQINADAKRRIARRAVDLVKDGDVILLDASATVFHIAPFLEDFKNLTVVTNGIEVGRILAKNTSHTVVLLGGVIRSSGISVAGYLGEKNLDDLHIKTAFISCFGFSFDNGLTESDFQEAGLKSKMVRSTGQVVALVDSSKFGRSGLTSFAGLDQLDYIYTDSDIDAQALDHLRQSRAVLTVCGETTVTSFAPGHQHTVRYKIGFANIGEEGVPFAVDVRRGLEQAAQEAGNVDLILMDNRLSGEAALKAAEDLISAGVDLAIEYQIDEKVGNILSDKYKQAGIPVIAVDIPMVGATYFGVENYRAGYMAGAVLGSWIKDNWQGKIEALVLFEEPRAGALPASRIQGQLDGLQEVIGEIQKSIMNHLESGVSCEESEQRMIAVLKSQPKGNRLAVITMNDDAALGALNAALKTKRENCVVIVGQGADRRVREHLRRSGSRIIGSTAYWPERYGERILRVAMQILKGEPVPPAVYIEHVLITTDNINDYYPE